MNASPITTNECLEVLVDYTVPAIAHFNASSLQIDFGTCVGILAGCSASLQLTNTGSISGHLQVLHSITVESVADLQLP
eukprot:4535983-Amphidinium_carterae.2